jgi:alcohol dehydrogenase (NADP+)
MAPFLPLPKSIVLIQKVNEAYDRLLKSDVKYRFVIDMASLKA